MSDSLTESIRLFERLRTEDSQAAEVVFHRYVGRLTALVSARLSSKLAHRIDPEDVVQSAYRTFFKRTQDGDFELMRGGDLWRLLAAITVNKLKKQIERNTAGKRDFTAEESVSGLRDDTQKIELALPDQALTPADEVAMAEEIDYVLRDLTELQRRMLEMRLAGYLLEEIAAETCRSERTVRRLMDKIKDRLEERSAELAADS